MRTNQAKAISQAEIEQATGLTREVLRKWELRYQFPVPLRGARGQRLYQADDVLRLQLIKRLIHQGLRPGKLVHQPLDALQSLLDHASSPSDTAVTRERHDAAVQALLGCLMPGAAPLALSQHLDHLLGAAGLAHFVEQYLPAFNQAVGEAWAQGPLNIYAEHRYTEQVRQAVLIRIASLPRSHHLPRVLLTTPPGELHSLGLLALQAALALQGADCVNLGPQTPAAALVLAVQDLEVKVLAISVSPCFCPEALQRYLLDLRQQLPPDCALWLGGQGSEALPMDQRAGLVVFESIGQAVQAWHQLRPV